MTVPVSTALGTPGRQAHPSMLMSKGACLSAVHGSHACESSGTRNERPFGSPACIGSTASYSEAAGKSPGNLVKVSNRIGEADELATLPTTWSECLPCNPQACGSLCCVWRRRLPRTHQRDGSDCCFPVCGSKFHRSVYGVRLRGESLS